MFFTSAAFQTKSSARRCGAEAKAAKGAARVRIVETADGWVYKLYA